VATDNRESQPPAQAVSESAWLGLGRTIPILEWTAIAVNQFHGSTWYRVGESGSVVFQGKSLSLTLDAQQHFRCCFSNGEGCRQGGLGLIPEP
jgi:hypothetical protein